MNFVRLALFFPLFQIINGNATKSLWDEDEEEKAQVFNTFPKVRPIKEANNFSETHPAHPPHQHLRGLSLYEGFVLHQR